MKKPSHNLFGLNFFLFKTACISIRQILFFEQIRQLIVILQLLILSNVRMNFSNRTHNGSSS